MTTKQLIEDIDEDIYRYRRYRDYPGLTTVSPKQVERELESLRVSRTELIRRLRSDRDVED